MLRSYFHRFFAWKTHLLGTYFLHQCQSVFHQLLPYILVNIAIDIIDLNQPKPGREKSPILLN
ncbi:MAG: hypothetical protein DM484_14195 [Candidatus Methylumidiphilus alinenensis]|uniref:Uncharacterized protein n=1 Tax=Candidatus Methylumidiphilus alinenensis TaxID=2202197 RepID=A0A2W4RCQ9_9GAMM|nr:MAG: hypothetical protein DM484_14195 [Candidatus Methylumidiphilus alinenensis]